MNLKTTSILFVCKTKVLSKKEKMSNVKKDKGDYDHSFPFQLQTH